MKKLFTIILLGAALVAHGQFLVTWGSSMDETREVLGLEANGNDDSQFYILEVAGYPAYVLYNYLDGGLGQIAVMFIEPDGPMVRDVGELLKAKYGQHIPTNDGGLKWITETETIIYGLSSGSDLMLQYTEHGYIQAMEARELAERAERSSGL